MDEFDRDILESIVDKVVVGAIDEELSLFYINNTGGLL